MCSPRAAPQLEIPPADIDVNVHPTKREVKFLNEAAIIDHIQESLDALLQGGNESRTFYTQMLLTGVVRKTPLFEQFIHKHDHFTKTGSGQT